MTDGGDEAVATDDLTDDDRLALGWAVSTDHPIGKVLIERARRGESEVRANELAEVFSDWDRAGRPVPQRCVQRTPVTFTDGTTSDAVAVRYALSGLRDRARTGALVEVGCLDGHGRTGTALGCLAILAGTPASDTVAWARNNYCDKAVETNDQAQFVAGFGACAVNQPPTPRVGSRHDGSALVGPVYPVAAGEAMSVRSSMRVGGRPTAGAIHSAL